MTGLLPSEHDIQSLCNNYLRMMGWYVMRLNSGKIPMQSKHGTRMIQLADPGTPDSFAFKQRPSGMSVLFVEYKRPKNKPTYLQEQKMIELSQHGAKCLVIHSLEELQTKLKEIDK